MKIITKLLEIAKRRKAKSSVLQLSPFEKQVMLALECKDKNYFAPALPH